MPQSSSRILPHKTAPGTFKSVRLEDIPGTAILFDALRPLEQEMLRRGLVASSNAPTHPLWFLAETERNVFLWRNGFSLSDQGKFEFWIDIPKLAERRRGQVENGLTVPGFSNPFLSAAGEDGAGQGAELQYLEVIEELLSRVYMQAFELSLITRTIHRELIPQERPIIVLPQARASEGRNEV